MLSLRHVVAGYGPIACLKGVSLEVRQGEIVALLGANGAGKTTTLCAISGLVRLHQGAIEFEGRPIHALPAERIPTLGIGHVPEGRRVFPRLTVAENLALGAYLRRDRAAISRDLAHVWELFPILRERRRQLAGTLSGGEQQMLAIGRGLMGRPRLLLLDEPSLGLAPKLVTAMFEIVRRINRDGTTVLLVEQNAHLALQIAHRGYIMETGRIVLSDAASSLACSPQVKAAYLGG
jgi:branched-chain amino acid transport system ATP-binding protein